MTYSKKYQARRGKTWERGSKNKFGAIRSGGYDSKLEERVANGLKLRMKARKKDERVVEYQEQYVLPIRVEGELITNHRVDFMVKYGDGRHELIEAKGLDTPRWKLIRKLIEALLPAGKIENTESDWTYRVVRKNDIN